MAPGLPGPGRDPGPAGRSRPGPLRVSDARPCLAVHPGYPARQAGARGRTAVYALPGKPRCAQWRPGGEADERASPGEQGLDAPPPAHHQPRAGRTVSRPRRPRGGPGAPRYRGQPPSRALGPGCAYPPIGAVPVASLFLSLGITGRSERRCTLVLACLHL